MTPEGGQVAMADRIGGPAPHTPRGIPGPVKQGRIGQFVPALLDPQSAVPEGLVDVEGRAAGKRFDVYRNNVVVSLSAAMAVGFPVIEKLVGAPFFSAMAGVFVRAHPPRSPVLAMYGAAFPEFLESFPILGWGRVAEIEGSEDGLDIVIENPFSEHIITGRVWGMMEAIHERDYRLDWKVSEQGELELKLRH